MEFMMLIYPGPGPEMGAMPSKEIMEAMGKFNEELVNAGALIWLDGLKPTSKGARVVFSGGKPTVTDGPFTETKEILGGFWIIKAASKEEAVEWAKRVPAEEGNVIEVRQVYEMSDFPADIADSEAQARVIEAIGR